MIPANKGLIVDELGLGQLSDMNGTQLVWTKTSGTVGVSCETDSFTASGTNTGSYSWSYTALPSFDNPAKLVINVTKTPI